MSEISDVAKAYFNGATVADQEMARKYFKNLDENGDGKVSLDEFLNKAGSDFSSENNFRIYDENGDGVLQFEEALTVYYTNKVSIPACCECRSFLTRSAYFSCLQCQGKTSYTLCCGCYRGRKFEHHHPSDDFADSRALLKLLEQLMGEAQRKKANRNANPNHYSSSSSAFNLENDSRTGGGRGSTSSFDILNDVMDGMEAVDELRAMMNGEEASQKEETTSDMNDIVEAVGEGIDINDNVDAVGEGIDMLDLALDVASTATDFGCSIM